MAGGGDHRENLLAVNPLGQAAVRANMSSIAHRVLVAANVAITVSWLWHAGLGRYLRQLRRLVLRPPKALAEPDFHNLLGKDYVPPLPKPIAEALEKACLCYLATSGAEHTPHLSLMRFTYTTERGEDGEPIKGSEVMIISTRRDTKKFQLITCNTSVALLVHEFETDADSAGRNYEAIGERTRFSITLNGQVRVQEGYMAECYRKIHLASNPNYSQFIVGDEVAIITVHLDSARVCDINDRVSHFARQDKSWKDVTHEPSSPS